MDKRRNEGDCVPNDELYSIHLLYTIHVLYHLVYEF